MAPIEKHRGTSSETRDVHGGYVRVGVGDAGHRRVIRHVEPLMGVNGPGIGSFNAAGEVSGWLVQQPPNSPNAPSICPYLVADSGQRDNHNYVPESSRRARAVPVYAAIRSLGHAGIAELIERNCAQARRMAERLAAIPGAKILNHIVLNQVLMRLPGGDDANKAAIAAIQRDGTCWLGGTTWHGQYVLRVSICN